MRLLPVVLLLAGCATTRAAQPLPCADDDAARCVQFVELVRSATGRGGSGDATLSHALERFCLRGSTESCQLLAKQRSDDSLAELCRDGATEACDLPADKRAPQSLLEDCKQRKPGACRAWFDGARLTEAPPRAVLEAACDEGIARTCFALAQALRAAEAERARTLTWRSCLAGVREACAVSQDGVARCRRGVAPACEPFDFVEGESAEVHAKTRSLLEAACGEGVVLACLRLVHELGDAATYALACRHAPACEKIAGYASTEVLSDSCRSGEGVARDIACGYLVELLDPEEQEDASPVRAWARARCDEARGQARDCWPLVRWLKRRGHELEARRVQCSAGPCEAAEGLAMVDRCLEGPLDACPHAALWLQQERLLRDDNAREVIEVGQRVLRRACEAKEAMYCIRAADFGPVPVAERLRFVERGCALGSKDGCERAAELTAAKRACDAGKQCADWVMEMRDEERSTGVKLLEKTCGKGVRDDCATWRDLVGVVAALLKCEVSAALCPVEKDVRPRLTATLKRCEAEHGEACAQLVVGLQDGTFETLSRSDLRRPQPDLLRWASWGCDVSSVPSCELAVSLSDKPDRERAAVKACDAGSALNCRILAYDAWHEGNRGDTLTPALVKARERALRACTLGDAAGCSLAADFFESGVGGPADALEAERLRNR